MSRSPLVIALAALAAGHAAAADSVPAPASDTGVECPGAVAWDETLDQDNIAWLRGLIKAPDLQQKALPILTERYEAGELPATDLARLVDRILVKQNKPQRFGTQFDRLSGKFPLPDAARVTEIDANRRKLGLMSIADYACLMNDRFRAPRWDGPPPEG